MRELFIKRFAYYKEIADKTFAQLTDEQLFWQPNDESNSVAVIVKHIAGNMISRWTNFLTEDGEKSWRNHDEEFINNFKTRKEVLDFWENGWRVLYEALDQISENNLYSEITIRGEKHSVLDAVLRQLAHHAYHVGQIIYIGKILRNEEWQSLSIPRNRSENYNAEMQKKYSNNNHRGNASPVCYLNSDEVRNEYRDNTDPEGAL